MKVADIVSEVLGGQPKNQGTGEGEGIEVLTHAESVEIFIEGPSALYSEMRLYKAESLHEYRGSEEDSIKSHHFGLNDSAPSWCKPMRLSRSGRGLQPYISLTFRLGDAPKLGKFVLVSTSWALAERIHDLARELDEAGGAVRAQLIMEKLEFMDGGGSLSRSYSKPVVKVVGVL